MTTKKQILKFNIITGIILLLSILYVLALVWGKQVWFFPIFFIEYGSYDFIKGEGPLIINYPLFIAIADVLGNLYLWSNLPRANEGLPTDDLRF